MNETITKFGYPGTLIRDYAHWVVLLRPKQATLGALSLACKEEALAWSEATPAATAELAAITQDIEGVLGRSFGYQKINYLMLMMVDPHVHFHVLPRYDGPKEFAGASFDDPGWPAVPNVGHATDLDEAQFAQLLAALKDAWPKG
jgi:diadenosine tetraphosphate (Ap4A) HIT family hydrolase